MTSAANQQLDSSRAREREPSRARARWLALIPFALVAPVLAIVAFWRAFTTFYAWDDEGYFLLALRAYREGGGLYERIRGVFYGPMYFQSVSGFFALFHVPMDTAGARWLLLSCWAIASAAIARAAARWSGTVLAGWLALALGLPVLLYGMDEPLHANSPILFFFSLVAFACTGAVPNERVRAACCGALCAAILLVKLNVGVFALLAFAAAFAPAGPTIAARAARALVAAALILIPSVWMQRLFDDPSIVDFAVLVSIALLPFAVLLVRSSALDASRTGSTSAAQRVAFAAAFAALTMLSIGLCLVRQSSLAGLWRGLVVEGLRFPTLEHHAPEVPSRAFLALDACALPIAFLLLRSRAAALALRFGASLLLLHPSIRREVPLGALPFVWLAVSGERWSGWRFPLGVMTVLAVLQAYPLAGGSQLGCFSLLAALVGVVGIFDALRDAATLARAAPKSLRAWRIAVVAGCSGLLALQSPLWSVLGDLRRKWNENVALDLPGSGPLRLPERTVARFQWIAANLREHGSTFLGVPGMHSFYAWSGLEPPVAFYPHHWVAYYDADEQRDLLRSTLASERPCVLQNFLLTEFWSNEERAAGWAGEWFGRTPLREVGRAGLYAIFVPASNRADVVLCATPLENAGDLLSRFGAERGFVLSFPAMRGVSVSRVAVHDFISGQDVLESDADSDERRIVLMDRNGQTIDAHAPSIELSQRTDLWMLCPPFRAASGASNVVVRAHDARGEIVARLLFLPSRSQ